MLFEEAIKKGGKYLTYRGNLQYYSYAIQRNELLQNIEGIFYNTISMLLYNRTALTYNNSIIYQHVPTRTNTYQHVPTRTYTHTRTRHTHGN